MVFARHSGGTGTTPEEENEARTRPDISVFPLATPLIAGPGAISATILLASPVGLFTLGWFEVVVAMLAILLLCYLAMLVAIPIQRLLGLTSFSASSPGICRPPSRRAAAPCTRSSQRNTLTPIWS